MELGGEPEMSDLIAARSQQAEDVVDETVAFLDSLSNRTSDTAESIAELADEMEELSSEIRWLLDDLRTLQSRLAPPARGRLEPLIDQLEGIHRGLQTAVWTMDCAGEGLPEDADLVQILEDSCNLDEVDGL